jgi:hypothetical protein
MTAQHRHHPPASPPSAAQEPGLPDGPFYRANGIAMERMHAEMHRGPWSGDIDRDFLVMMIPHHQGAVDMAELLLRYGRDPLVRMIAEKVIAGQQTEISAMRARLAFLEGGGTSEREFPALGGLRGDAHVAGPTRAAR